MCNFFIRINNKMKDTQKKVEHINTEERQRFICFVERITKKKKKKKKRENEKRSAVLELASTTKKKNDVDTFLLI